MVFAGGFLCGSSRSFKNNTHRRRDRFIRLVFSLLCYYGGCMKVKVTRGGVERYPLLGYIPLVARNFFPQPQDQLSVVRMSGLVCVSLGTSSVHVLSALEQLDRTQEMAEIRIDLLTDYQDAPGKVFPIAKELGITTIATVREIKADPGFSITRLSLLKNCMESGATFVDIEVESPEEYRKAAIAAAKEHNVKIIISHHEYAVAEESSENLSSVIEECFDKGAHVAKVAVAVCSPQGAARVLNLYNDTRSIVALGMGEYGKLTRVGSILLGAPFSFAAWDLASATAPGQLTREQMKQALSVMGWTGDSSRKRIKPS